MNTKWEKRFMEMAFLNASWSKDPSTQVGAVITHKNRIVSMGFNGYPHGIADNQDPREIKLLKVIHAEENAILHANRSLEDCAIFATHFPCPNCTAKIIQVGIKTIYVPDFDEDYFSRWKDFLDVSKALIAEASIEVIKVDGFIERANTKTSHTCSSC
tara:strand:+ start:1008 stop:1481 length:474 start_codon:yes stop_codon:yes gene_type:complete